MSQVQDAQLILQFYELRREPKLRDARSFMAGRFKASTMEELDEMCPPGSEENAFFRQVVSYWDMIGAIVKRDIVDKELFFETNGEITLVFEKIRKVLPAMRERYESPTFLANLEQVAAEREAYLNQVAPGSLASFRKRLGLD